MELGIFYIDENNTIQLNKYKMVVRSYETVEKSAYNDTTYFMDETNTYEWETNIIPKHQLLELVSKENLDATQYSWMAGITLVTENSTKEIEQIVSYGSYEAYIASLPVSNDAYQIETDYRISKLELGL